MVTVVTNIEADHMATYGGDFENLKKYFVDFLHNLPFYGLAVLCIDDPGVKSILGKVSRPVITYGFSKKADYRVSGFKQIAGQIAFEVQRPDKKQSIKIKLDMPGKHNALNAAAAVAIASDEGIKDAAIKRGIKKFSGVGRRFDVQGDFPVPGGSVTLIDDYGHHPSEVAATVQALRAGWPNQRFVMVFQPHRFSRTADLYDDFVEVLSEVDVLLLLEVYSAGEKKIPGADSRSLSRSIRLRGKVDPVLVQNEPDLLGILRDMLRPGDMVLTQGAGSVGGLARDLASKGFLNR
jgi:UDP-N-acetylmuramate--alanine ligase